MEPRPWGAFLAVVLLAAALRVPDLARRPMHADEAVNAEKFGALLEGKGYAYDPSDYHGPTLYYLTLLPAWIRGERRYVDVDEVTLRCVPAALGVALVAAHVGARASLGAPAALAAALLAALSPAMVFYGRYYIHEMALVLFTFGALLAIAWYVRRPTAVAALVSGACAGLMLATKETALLALASMLVALGITAFVERTAGRSVRSVWTRALVRDLALAALAAMGVASTLLSSFGGNFHGLVDAGRAYSLYVGRAGAATVHVHPWSYYLGLLAHFPARGTPFWSEGLILVLAMVGGVSGWMGANPPGEGAKAVRFLSLYTLLMVVAYSAIPYKTPWCLLGFLDGMILLAGVGAVTVVRASGNTSTRTVVAAFLAGGAAHLGFQAVEATFRFDADPRNPYVYAQTGTDVFEILARLQELARVRPDGASLRIDVVSRANLWPLPWYLRRFPNVAWWSGVSDEARVAPVVLLTPDMESALARRLYDVPAPGERELYLNLFERRLELRPGVELRGYVASGLAEGIEGVDRDGARPGSRGVAE